MQSTLLALRLFEQMLKSLSDDQLVVKGQGLGDICHVEPLCVCSVVLHSRSVKEAELWAGILVLAWHTVSPCAVS